MPLTINKNKAPLVTDKTIMTAQNILSFHDTNFDVYDDFSYLNIYVLTLMTKPGDIYVYVCTDS